MKKYWPIIFVVSIFVLGIVYLQFSSKSTSQVNGGGNSANKSAVTKVYPPYEEIVNPSGYINSEPFTLEGLIGKKVILVDFMTYSCINCLRTFPYLNDWYEKYQDQGLEIVGIHTPEFEFEKKYNNVKKELDKHKIKFPVVLDNDYGTWSAYKNRYWPRKYLIDINGNIVYDHIGEGKYDETEEKIQQLLSERMEKLDIAGEIVGEIKVPSGVEVVDTLKERSPEIYFGASRNEWLANGSIRDTVQTYVVPDSFKLDKIYLGGDWFFSSEYAQNSSKKARIIFRYRGEKVFFVASSKDGVNLTILRDGKPISVDAAGSDVKDGMVSVKDDRLYRLIEDKNGSGIHTLEIIIDNPGLSAFTFTFG